MRFHPVNNRPCSNLDSTSTSAYQKCRPPRDHRRFRPRRRSVAGMRTVVVPLFQTLLAALRIADSGPESDATPAVHFCLRCGPRSTLWQVPSGLASSFLVRGPAVEVHPVRGASTQAFAREHCRTGKNCGQGQGNNASYTIVLRDIPARISRDLGLGSRGF